MLKEHTDESLHWKNPVDITKEQWIFLLEDEDVIRERDFRLLTIIYSCDSCMATAKQLMEILRMPHHAPINSQVGHLGKRIVKALNVQPPKQKSGGGVNWWNVPFWGTSTKEGFYWILRPELREAMQEIEVPALLD